MKRSFLALAFAAALVMGTTLAAQAENTGVYVAPKVMMTWQNNNSSFDHTITGGAGGGVSESNTQLSMGGALAVGYDFWQQHKLPVRAELEFAMRGNNNYSNDYSNVYGTPGMSSELKVNYNASTLMANFFYDFHNSTSFTPYLTAGLGLAFINTEYEYNVRNAGASVFGMNESENFTNFAWNVGAGVAYSFNENVSVDLGYRYVNLGNVNVSGSRTIPGTANQVSYECDNFASNHEVMLGLRLTF